MIRKVSKKQSKKLHEYSQRRRKFLIERPLCEVITCDSWSSDVHHKAGRGINLMYESTWMAVCRSCHRQIEDNPQWAKDNGYSLSRLNKKIP
jgi:hypothetical protein